MRACGLREVGLTRGIGFATGSGRYRLTILARRLGHAAGTGLVGYRSRARGISRGVGAVGAGSAAIALGQGLVRKPARTGFRISARRARSSAPFAPNVWPPNSSRRPRRTAGPGGVCGAVGARGVGLAAIADRVGRLPSPVVQASLPAPTVPLPVVYASLFLPVV